MLLWCHRPLLEMVDLALNPEAQDAYWAAAVLRTEVGARVLMRDDVLFSWNFFFFVFVFCRHHKQAQKQLFSFILFFPACPYPKDMLDSIYKRLKATHGGVMTLTSRDPCPVSYPSLPRSLSLSFAYALYPVMHSRAKNLGKIHIIIIQNRLVSFIELRYFFYQ